MPTRWISRWILVLIAGMMFCPLVLAQPRQPFPGQPKQPFPGQPNQPNQPFPGQPNQPFPGQPNQPFPGQPNQPNQVIPAPNQPFPGQPNQPDPFKTDPELDRAAGRACGGAAVFFIVVIGTSLTMTIVWIFVSVWVAKDAAARGMDNGALWGVLVFFVGLIGLIIYLVMRPSEGRKAPTMRICRECGRKRPRAIKRCPNCAPV